MEIRRREEETRKKTTDEHGALQRPPLGWPVGDRLVLSPQKIISECPDQTRMDRIIDGPTRLEMYDASMVIHGGVPEVASPHHPSHDPC